MAHPPRTETFFAVAAPGLEALVEDELRELGLVPRRESLAAYHPGQESGGAYFEGRLEDLYRANLYLRTASRVLVRLGDFYATAFSELRTKAARLEWARYLKPGQPVQMRVACHKSRLYHSDAVAERVAAAIGDRLGKASALCKPQPSGEDRPPQLVVVRILNDHCTLSIDSSGALLHRRGYRLETAKAPLRETLAAAMLIVSGWDKTSPLLDPFCGSGTIAIEAAQMALGLPPGEKRNFAFMDWPGYDPLCWDRIVQKAQSIQTQTALSIQASDRDAGAIQMAMANAERAGVAGRIEFSQRAISAVEPPPGPGWVVTNPPYGLRVSHGNDLRDLYSQFGHVLRRCCLGWHVAILGNDLRLFGQLGLDLDTSFGMVNGGVKVRLARGVVEAG
jgi:putative N6-adenine-specific DNA methylase